MVTENL